MSSNECSDCGEEKTSCKPSQNRCTLCERCIDTCAPRMHCYECHLCLDCAEDTCLMSICPECDNARQRLCKQCGLCFDCADENQNRCCAYGPDGRPRCSGCLRYHLGVCEYCLDCWDCKENKECLEGFCKECYGRQRHNERMNTLEVVMENWKDHELARLNIDLLKKVNSYLIYDQTG